MLWPIICAQTGTITIGKNRNLALPLDIDLLGPYVYYIMYKYCITLYDFRDILVMGQDLEGEEYA